MTPMQLLKKDHAAVKRLFGDFDRTNRRATRKRRELVDRIGIELEIHARLEEELFYPALDGIAEARELLAEARDDHQSVRELLEEIRGIAPANDLRTFMKELRDAVLHHASEEEREIFPLAERLGEGQLEELAERVEGRKADLTEELAPRRRRRAA